MRKVKEVIQRSNDQAWANGCKDCRYGMVNAPAILAAFPINEGRAVQAADGMIDFCGCKAGHMYRQFARRTYNAMSAELRLNIREHIAAVAPVPTVHA